ncbi:glycerophosphodiester phosphodiesterase [Cryobacterium psychrophilum]|uniref:Uncharacterized protein n=1 Tax=Cryobacterium psychrophilum TaxID=41988 RepID=A0A4Y8KMI4_9MICO|nr:glycerophosphodiester phosphodiesterase [Cryobacterium psychrophilum]TDW30244.1 glycerophosphoryl diester phosphodiesterase [Cryobacterium psychrophilum]TFD77467.1 hypothetical protein E3T53_11670 [Cryobacterium psychrophilum]
MPLNRRQFLWLGATTFALTACQSAAPPPIASPTPTASVGPNPLDVLFATAPVFIAHRGSGDNWVEHTFDAYTRSIAFGAPAVEVSVGASSDGVLLCHHDATTTRMTGEQLVIAETSWDTLSGLHNDAREWLGPSAALQPIPRLDDVLTAVAHQNVVFIEDKQGTHQPQLVSLMKSFPEATSHFVWKQSVEYEPPAAILAAGYKTWGYFTKDLYARAEELGAAHDYLGVEHSATDAEIAQVVALGKPVVAWPIHYRSMRDRMLSLGVTGMMCSNVPYASTAVPSATTDAFASGLRAPGDLPWTMDKGTELQPVITAETASIAISAKGTQSYLMGSLCPVPADAYTLTFEMRWPSELPPDSSDHAGIAFGTPDDRPYRVRIVGDTPGYHVTVRASGRVELFSRAAQTKRGASLGAIRTAATRPGQWIRLQITVTPGGIRVSRVDGVGWSLDSSDTSYRGQYFWLCKNYYAGPPVEFRSISVTPVSDQE